MTLIKSGIEELGKFGEQYSVNFFCFCYSDEYGEICVIYISSTNAYVLVICGILEFLKFDNRITCTCIMIGNSYAFGWGSILLERGISEKF